PSLPSLPSLPFLPSFPAVPSPVPSFPAVPALLPLHLLLLLQWQCCGVFVNDFDEFLAVPPCATSWHTDEEFHDVQCARHFGTNMTLAVIEKYYYWPGMAADVQQFITSCDTCQRMKISKQTKAGLLQPLLVPEQPWQVVSLDFITGLPSTSRGHDAILVVIDKFSKMGHFIPTNATATTEATTHLFFDRIITIHGIPATLISYRDPKFTSNFLRELMGLLGTKLAMSSTYQPQTGGQTERLKYLAAMGEKYGLEEGRSVKTPLPSGFQLHLDEEEGEVLEYELQRRFQSMAPSRALGCSREAGEVLHGNLKGGAAIFRAWAAEAKGSGGGEHKDWCTCKAWALVPLVLHRCYLGK
ncbi:unnamed protein product, partial [Closterium sp. NIES-54]